MSSESEAAVKSGEPNQNLKSLGKYVIERKLGQGGMGTVYLAKNSDLKKTIALKVLPQDKAKNPTLVKRFKAEAQAAAKLEHPNIVAVYDSGEADGYLYIAMEYVDGLDLFEQVKRRGVVPVKRSIEIIKQVASALQHAFEQGIVHRDIKPSNLLVRRDGTIKLTDLGLARSIDDTLETNITRAGTTVGTVDYMAPEQARSSKLADIRSDIYSLGCTWYQMLTGEPPFPDGSMTNKLQAHATKQLPDPREINENVPEGVFAVLQRMTAKKPDDRYQTPAELLEDLSRSHLTKAAFANEIFSDSDDDLPATADHSDDDDDWDDDEPSENEPNPRNRVSNSVNETSPSSTRRKPPLIPEPDETDEPTRRKPRSRDTETGPSNETQPLKTGKRIPSKNREDDEDHDSPVAIRSSKKSNADSGAEENDDSSVVSKRRRNQSLDDDGKSSQPKRMKTSPAGETTEKKSAKASQKPMPPKRTPILEPVDESNTPNYESVKYLASVAGLLAVICGVGFLVFRWSNNVEVIVHPAPVNPTTFVDNANSTTKQAQGVETQESKDANAVDSSKASATVAVSEKPSEFDLAKQPFPAWATSDASEPGDLPILTVGPGAVSPTHFSNLDEALKAIDPNGGIIRLIGSGPFALSNFELKPGIRKLVITAAVVQDQPLIFFKPDDSGAFRGLSIENGILDLRGLHFIFDRPQDLPASSNKMISVIDGQLFVRSCSFTASGNESAAMTALSCNFKQDLMNAASLEPQLFLDRVIIRGSGLTGLSIDRPTIDAVIQDSLFLTGSAPAIVLNSRQSPPNAVEISSAKPRRIIRLSRTTLCVRTDVIEVSADNNSKPPTTGLLMQDSVCSVEGSGNSAVVISATRWPSNTANSNGWLTNFSLWSPSTLYLGFERLIDLDKSTFKVTNAESWQRVWGKKSEPRQFQSSFWQESTFADLSAALPQSFDSSSLPYHEIKSSAGALPGCVVSRLNVPGMISQGRLVAIGQRQKLPAMLQKPIDAVPWKKVDLSKEDLGQVINKNDWQTGTVIEATGSGLKPMSPARITGKSLRIIFRQGDGAPLKIHPKPTDQKANTDNQGLFSIEAGLLDLQSATIEASQSSKSASTPWLFSARNASLILRGCQLSGPLGESETHQGLIHWSTTGTYQPADGLETPFLSINDSFLMSNGNGLRVNCAQGNVFLRNSVLAIRGYGINVHPDYADFRSAPNLDMEHVTISATKAAIRFEAAQGVESAPAPIRFFVNYCAICSPLEFKAGEGTEAALLECVGPVRDQKQMQWWGTSNGIAKEVKMLLKQTDANPIESASEWTAAWGESSEFRMLTGAKAVVLSGPLPNKWANLKSSLFSLSPNCAAATWADTGQPLGADIHGVENSIVAKKTSMEPKTTSSNSSAPSNSTPTNSKKGVGF